MYFVSRHPFLECQIFHPSYDLIQNKYISMNILIHTFNREQFIGSTINNVLSQSFANFDLIIINDGSTDQTDKMIAIYQSDMLIFQILKL